VRVYAIKSNCDLQVHPGILKGVHLSKLTGQKDPLGPGIGKPKISEPGNSKALE
jgi:hypothetical protein